MIESGKRSASRSNVRDIDVSRRRRQELIATAISAGRALEIAMAAEGAEDLVGAEVCAGSKAMWIIRRTNERGWDQLGYA